MFGIPFWVNLLTEPKIFGIYGYEQRNIYLNICPKKLFKCVRATITPGDLQAHHQWKEEINMKDLGMFGCKIRS